MMAQTQLQPSSSDPYTMADLQHALELYETLEVNLNSYFNKDLNNYYLRPHLPWMLLMRTRVWVG